MHEGVVSQMIQQVSCPLYSELNESIAQWPLVSGSAVLHSHKAANSLVDY